MNNLIDIYINVTCQINVIIREITMFDSSNPGEQRYIDTTEARSEVDLGSVRNPPARQAGANQQVHPALILMRKPYPLDKSVGYKKSCHIIDEMTHSAASARSDP